MTNANQLTVDVPLVFPPKLPKSSLRTSSPSESKCTEPNSTPTPVPLSPSLSVSLKPLFVFPSLSPS